MPNDERNGYRLIFPDGVLPDDFDLRKNTWVEFLNYFDEGITQGFVEGTNRAIRGMINRAFGFRHFDNFKLQVLAEHGPP